MTMYYDGMSKGRPSDSPRTDFGERLFRLREERSITQSYVAERLGVSARAYAFWERKPVALQAYQIATLAEVFGVTADFIVGRSEPKPKRNGPKGKLEKMFEQIHNLPRSKQQRIVGVVEALVSQEA
jgi:transcriptional regulator with XRE-family HTH domain